jgi:3-hydroxybutyryl-CoA dehydrogenase
MRIVVQASENQKTEWLGKSATSDATIEFISPGENISGIEADAYFILSGDKNLEQIANVSQPFFVNAVTEILNELPENCIRINAWNGFLGREVVEIVASEKNKRIAGQVMNALGWKYIFVSDIRGMITARSISMIINEAYFALQEKVSTKDQIDIAMKLGTNYPYGPFEWSKKIGLKNIYHFLKKLSEENKRYLVAPLLEDEAMRIS